MSKFLIAEILGEKHVGKIDFSVGGFHIDPIRFASVRNGVLTERIQVRGSALPGYFAAYYFDNNELAIDASSVASPYGHSAVVHECVHAIHDLYRAERTTRLSSEVAAYTAQCLYLRLIGSVRRAPSGGQRDPELDRVFDLADGLVGQFDLERRRGVEIPYAAYESLRRALSRVYLDLSDTELIPHHDIGVPPRRAVAPPPSRSWPGGCAIGY